MEFNGSLERIKYKSLMSIPTLAMSLGLIDTTVLKYIFDNDFENSISNDIIAGGIGAVCSAALLKKMYAVYAEYKAAKKIVNSSYYKECSELYDKYVTNLTQLLSSLGFKNALETAICYDYMLYDGLLSKGKNYEYKKFKYDYDNFIELYGTRISTGQGVCRHNASLLTDLINKMDGNAINLSVEVSNNKYLLKNYKKMDKRRVSGNHLVTGLTVDDKKMIYDPTGHCLATFNSEKIKKLKINTSFFACGDSYFIEDKNFITNSQNIVYVLKDSQIYNYNSLISFEEFLKLPPKILNDKEVIDIYRDVLEKVNFKYDELLDFSKEQSPIVERLSLLNYILSPHSDKKIRLKK